MNLQEFLEKFKPLPPKQKIKFIYEQSHNLEEREKISFLLSFIKEKKNPSLVRASALKVLSQTSYQGSPIYLEYSKDPSQVVAKAARKILKELKTKNKKNTYLSNLVLRKIRSSKRKQIRLKIIKSIARLEDSWVNTVLLEALEDPSEEIRDFIIDELGSKGYLNQNLIYQKLLKPPWYVKSAVLKILGIRRNPDSINFIEAVLDDLNAEVRRSAAQALGEIGGKEAVALLSKLSKDKNRFVRRSAEACLRKISSLKFS